MERSIVAVEANPGGRGSSTPLPRSSGSPVKIDSISIDLGVSMEKEEAQPCEHFSIRGYVSEMRRRDRSICSPFTLDGKQCELEEELPPLLVAKFRWWRCQNCLQEIGASTMEDLGALSKCCRSGVVSSSTCSDVPSHGDTPTVPPDLHQAPKLENYEGKRADASSFLDINGNKCYPSSCSYKQRQNVDGHAAVNGQENVSKHVDNLMIGDSTCDGSRSGLCLNHKRRKDVTVAIESKGKGLDHICEPNHIRHDAPHTVLAIESPKFSQSSFTEICLADRSMSLHEGQRKLLSDEVANSDKSPVFRVPCLEQEECDNALAGSDNILVGDTIHSQQHDNSNGLPRRKAPKVRLLKELLGGKANAEIDFRRTEGASSKTMVNAYAGLDSVSAPQAEVAPQRKRKLPQDQEGKPLEISMAQKLRGDPEKAIEISESESEEDASAGVGILSGLKSQWSKHGSARSAIVGKSKNKQTQVGGTYSTLLPWREVVAKENAERPGTAAGTSFLKPTQEAFKGKGVEPYFEGYLPLNQTGKQSCSSQKKSKITQIEDGEASLVNKSAYMFGQGSMKRKGVVSLQSASETVKSQSIGLDLSLNSFTAVQGNDMHRSAQVEDQTDKLRQQKGILSKHYRKKDGLFVGEPSVSHAPALDPSLKEGLLCDLNERIAHRRSVLREQQNGSPQLRDGRFSQHKRLDFSRPCNNETATKVQRRAEVIPMHSDKRAEMFDQRTPDDVPMEIVELMAKNQYERGLYEAERNFLRSERSMDERGSPKVHANGVMRSLQKVVPNVKYAPSGNATNGIISTVESMAPGKNNPVNFSHLNSNRFVLGPWEEDSNHAFRMFGANAHSQQKLLTGVQHSASGSISNINDQYRERHGDKMGYRSYSHNKQILEAYNASRTEERGHVWSTVAPNHVSFGQNILQKCTTRSNNMEVRAQCSNLHKGNVIGDLDLNVSDLNASSHEQLNKNFDFDSVQKRPAEYPFITKIMGVELNRKGMGPSDSYCNETIPAMQLLSLMDAGAQSSTPSSVDAKKVQEKPFGPCDKHPCFNADGKPNLLEKPLFLHHFPSKEFTGRGPGVCEAVGSSRNPSSAYYGNYLPEKSRERSPAIPASDLFVSPFTNDGNSLRPTGFTGQVSVKSQEQERAKRPYTPTHNRGRHSQKSVGQSGASYIFSEPKQGQDKQKGIVGASDSVISPLLRHTLKDSTRWTDLEARRMHGIVWPSESISKSEICTVNKNPADFSIPEAGNAFMIKGEDLKVQKKITSVVKYGLVNVENQKRQNMKSAAKKEQARCQVS